MEREIEDLDALIAEAGGSAHLFGASSGGALALEAAAAGSAIDTIAVWEVPYAVGDDIRPRFEEYIADIVANIKIAMSTVDPTPYFQKYGENLWAAVKGYLDAISDIAAAPVIEKYTGVLAAADVYTANTVFWIMESMRLDLGYGSQVHP